MKKKQERGTQTSRDGKTVGVMLRVEVPTLEVCERVMARAKMMDLKRGGSGQVTVQDVMRHQLRKLERRLSRRKDTACYFEKAENNE